MVSRTGRLLVTVFVTMAVLVFLPAAGLCAGAAPGPVDDPDFELMDRYIQDMMRDCRIPGFSVGIVRNGEMIYAKGYGKADDTGRAVTPQTPFLIGSVSKTFTALAVMQLVENGKIDLDKPVRDYLPGFQLADEKASSEITVRQLMNHTSGIAEGTEFGVATLRGDDETIGDLVRKFRSVKPVYHPGTHFEYGNANYIILGELIQAVSGTTYEDYIQTNIFAPLAMAHSYTSAQAAKADGLAAGYRPIFGFPKVSALPYRKDFLPAYSIISCTEDMTHYMTAMMSGGHYSDAVVLSEQGINEMTGASVEISKWMSYGLGWYVTSGSVYHGGELPDYQAKVKLLPQDGVAVVLMYNTSSSTATELFNVGYRDKIETGIINVLYGVPPAMQPGQNPMDLNSQPMSVTYGLMLGLVILAMMLFVLSAWRLRSTRRRLAKSRFAFWRITVLSALLNVVLPVVLLIAVPSSAGADWAKVLYNIPDVGWFVLASSVLLLLGAGKGILVFRYLKGDCIQSKKLVSQ